MFFLPFVSYPLLTSFICFHSCIIVLGIIPQESKGVFILSLGGSSPGICRLDLGYGLGGLFRMLGRSSLVGME